MTSSIARLTVTGKVKLSTKRSRKSLKEFPKKELIIGDSLRDPYVRRR
jgi:ribosomal protein L30E